MNIPENFSNNSEPVKKIDRIPPAQDKIDKISDGRINDLQESQKGKELNEALKEKIKQEKNEFKNTEISKDESEIYEISLKILSTLDPSTIATQKQLKEALLEAMAKGKFSVDSETKEKTKSVPRTESLTNEEIAKESKKLPENRSYPSASIVERQERQEGYLFESDEILEIHPFSGTIETKEIGTHQVVINFNEKGLPIIAQHGQSGCSAAASYMLLKEHGKDLDLQKFFTRPISSYKSIMNDLKELNPQYKVLDEEGALDRLKRLKQELLASGSAITSIDDEGDKGIGSHVVVVDEVSEDLKYIRLRDPFHGWDVTVPAKAFIERFGKNNYIIQIPKSS